MNLEPYGEDLAFELAFWREGLHNPTYPIEQLGDLSQQLVDGFRALAIIALLGRADDQLFLHNLIRSGRARLAYLERLDREGLREDHHYVSGRYGGIMAALAADDFALAREIGDLSPADWRDGHEYEDDFCVGRLLYFFAHSTPDPAAIAAALQQLETWLAGDASARLEAFKALANRDAVAFGLAFESLLQEREAEIVTAQERGQLEDPGIIADRRVFVEGLALLRIADHLNIATPPEYRYCPSSARVALTEPFPGD